MKQDVLDQLSQHGYRLTAPRRAVVRVLEREDAWLSPDEVHSMASALCPSIGLVTVYRTLGLLAELGLARRIHREGGCHGYALAESGHGHHLVCTRCHRVVPFTECDLDALEARLEARTGFKIENHVLELVGVCPECRA